MKRGDVARLIRISLIGGIATWCIPAYAQEANTIPSSASETGSAILDRDAQDIIVTGSRIARRDYEAESPVVTVTALDLQISGQPTLGESLNQLPQVSAGDSATRIGSGGRTTVDLRGLGARRTLVLLDGKRMQPSDLFNSIDLNGIPASLISSTEIITGGASAIYGSDALAGVINFQLRKNFSGIELDAQQGITDEGDGANFNISATVGTNFADGRGNIVLSASYLDRKDIFPQTSRKFFREYQPLSLPNNGLALAQGNNLYDPAVLAATFAAYGVTPPPGLGEAFIIGFNPDKSLFLTSRGGVNYQRVPGVDSAVIDGMLKYLPGTYSTLALPLKRYTAFGRGSYDVTDNINAFLQFNYSTFKTRSQGDAIVLPQDSPFVPVTNPFIPADLKALLDSRPDPTAPFYWTGFPNAAGLGGSASDSDVWQIQAGLSGKLPTLGWSWDVYFGTGRTTQRTTTSNLWSRGAFSALINAPDGGASICAGGLDLFPFINISDECRATLTRDPTNYQRLSQQVAEANLTGALFSLPGGDVRFAAGLAYRRNAFNYRPDAGVVANPANVGGLPDLITSGQLTAPSSGSTKVKEGYIELLVPILADRPFFQRLEVDLAYRYSDYDTVGGVSTYKASGEWEPVDGVLLRGGFQRAIRAPSIGELFAPVEQGVTTSLGNNFDTGGGDPCDVRGVYRNGPNGAQVAALCVAQGIPATDIGTWQVNGTGVPSLISGNLDLKEETGDSITIGAVVRPDMGSSLLSDLTVSVDFYDIKIKDAIGIVPGNAVVRACFNTGGENPTYSNDNFYCSLIKRGFISLQQVQTPTLNLARIHTSGIDTQVDWRVNLEMLGIGGNPGSLNVNVNVSWLDKYEIASLPGTPMLDYSETIGNDALGGLSHPTWKGIGTLTYARDGFQIGARARYIGKMNNSQNVNSPLALEGVKAITYVDLFARINVNEEFSLRAGVTNVTDKSPPVWTGLGATDRATYDVIGRSFYVGATARF